MRIRAVVTLAVAAVAISMAIPAFAAKGGTGRPYKNAGTETGTFDNSNGNFDITGPFIASHLGKGTGRTVEAGSGEFTTYTAANGDTLNARGLNDNLPTDGFVCADAQPGEFGPFPFSETVIYNGGTGRFTNATGKTISDGCLYFGGFDGVVPFRVTYSEKGTLTY